MGVSFSSPVTVSPPTVMRMVVTVSVSWLVELAGGLVGAAAVALGADDEDLGGGVFGVSAGAG